MECYFLAKDCIVLQAICASYLVCSSDSCAMTDNFVGFAQLGVLGEGIRMTKPKWGLIFTPLCVGVWRVTAR